MRVQDLEKSVLNLNTIQKTILRLNFPFVPNIYRLLSVDEYEGMLSFSELIERGLREFEEYYPMVDSVVLELQDGSHTFQNNFFQYIDREITDNKVEVKPTAVVLVSEGSGRNNSFISSSSWSYEPKSGIFKCGYSLVRLKCFYRYPYRAVINPSKTEFTVNSGVYFVGRTDWLIDQLSLTVLSRVREYSEMMTLPGFSSNVNFSNTITRLETLVGENRLKSPVMYEKWSFT